MAVELTPETLARATKRLAARDPDLALLIHADGIPPMWNRRPGFACLVHMILEQQVSLASARACFDRVRAMSGRMTPRSFLTLTDAQLKRAGFSRQKAVYCRDLAAAVLSRRIDLKRLPGRTDDEVLSALTALKGIGPWTASVYLLMALRRPDVWPPGDLALAAAVQDVKRLRRRPDAERLRTIAQPWRPWRSVAARLLWQRYLKQRKP